MLMQNRTLASARPAMTAQGGLPTFLLEALNGRIAPITVIQRSPASALNRTFRQARLVTEIGGFLPVRFLAHRRRTQTFSARPLVTVSRLTVMGSRDPDRQVATLPSPRGVEPPVPEAVIRRLRPAEPLRRRSSSRRRNIPLYPRIVPWKYPGSREEGLVIVTTATPVVEDTRRKSATSHIFAHRCATVLFASRPLKSMASLAWIPGEVNDGCRPARNVCRRFVLGSAQTALPFPLTS